MSYVDDLDYLGDVFAGVTLALRFHSRCAFVFGPNCAAHGRLLWTEFSSDSHQRAEPELPRVG